MVVVAEVRVCLLENVILNTAKKRCQNVVVEFVEPDDDERRE